MPTKYDVVYWRRGGTENFEWLATYPDDGDIDGMVEDLERMGYRAVRGLRSIGPPDTYEA